MIGYVQKQRVHCVSKGQVVSAECVRRTGHRIQLLIVKMVHVSALTMMAMSCADKYVAGGGPEAAEKARILLKLMQFIGAVSGGKTVTQVALNYLMCKGEHYYGAMTFSLIAQMLEVVWKVQLLWALQLF